MYRTTAVIHSPFFACQEKIRVLLLLSLLLLPAVAMSGSRCVESPIPACLLALAEADLSSISPDDKEHWNAIHDGILLGEGRQAFIGAGLDGLWPVLDRIQLPQYRSSLVAEIAELLALRGDKRVKDLVWEMEGDRQRLTLMLRVVQQLLDSGQGELAEEIYADAWFLFSKLGRDELDRSLYLKMIKMAKLFRDENLLASLAADYQLRGGAERNYRVLLDAGAQQQSLAQIMRDEAGRGRVGRTVEVSEQWISARGREALRNALIGSDATVFRAAAMYALARHAARELKDPVQAQQNLMLAEEYAGALTSIAERDYLYEKIGKQYFSLSQEYGLDLDDEIMSLGRKIDDMEESLDLLGDVVKRYLNEKNSVRAEAFIDKVNLPLLSMFYHYLQADMAREEGNMAIAAAEANKVVTYLDDLEPRKFRAEVDLAVGEFFHKLGDDRGAHELYLKSAAESRQLPSEERVRNLIKCARALREIEQHQEAAGLLQQAARALTAIGDQSEMLRLMQDVSAEASYQQMSSYMTQQLYQLEQDLQGEAIVEYYIKRAEMSRAEEQKEAALRFLTMALEQSASETAVSDTLGKGLAILVGDSYLPLRLSLLQHPAVPFALQQKYLSRYLNELRNKGNYQGALQLVELLDRQAQLGSLIELLDHAHAKGDALSAKRIYQVVKQKVKETPRLKSVLLELLIDNIGFDLMAQYGADVEHMIDSLADEGLRLYFRAMQLRAQPGKEDVLHEQVSGMLPQVLALVDRGLRARVLLLLARSLSPLYFGEAY